MIYIEIYASRAQSNYLFSSLILWEAHNAFLTFLLSLLWKSIFHDPILMIIPLNDDWLKVKNIININKNLGVKIHFHGICHLYWTTKRTVQRCLKDLRGVLKRRSDDAILRNLLDTLLETFLSIFVLHFRQ